MHRQNKPAAALLLALMSTGAAAADAAHPPYEVYSNWQYSYQIAYPVFLVPQGVSDAGDGQLFRSKNGDATLRVSGHACVDEIDYPSTVLRAYAKKEKAHEIDITYRHKTRETAVVSGYRGAKIFYAKALFENGHCSVFEFTYDTARRDVYDKVAARIAASFKPFDEMPREVR